MRHSSPAIAALAGALRAARQARGLSQQALAAASGASRVTLARFESGAVSDVGLGTLCRAGAALGMTLVLAADGGQERLEVKLARGAGERRRIDARRRHAALAARLLAMPDAEARALLRRAKEAVDRWERERLCSSHYIERWRARLSGGVRRAALALVEHDAWTDALFQNTPWSFALERPAP